METPVYSTSTLSAFRGKMALSRLFLFYGWGLNWLAPLLLGFILMNILTILPETIWFHIFLSACAYNVFYGWLVYMNRENVTLRSITPFAAWLWVSWPFVLAMGGIVSRQLHG